MKSVLELMMSCFWIAILFSCTVVVIMFIVGFLKAYYQIFIKKNSVDKDLYNGNLN